MPYITKRNGVYVVEKLGLSKTDDLFLECGKKLEVNISKVDNRHITDQQRKFIFALCNDIGYYMGEDSEWVRMLVQTYNAKIREIEVESLSSCSVAYANGLIDTIINFCIDQHIPLEGNTINEYQYHFDEKQTYAMALQRYCVICGRRADIHHVDHVGMRNRKKISHIGMRALPLCREHHIIAHSMTTDDFLNKYHLTPFVIDKKMEFFIKRGKIREFED